MRKKSKRWRKCPICQREFYRGSNITLSNRKGFCSKKCYEDARKLYIAEETEKVKIAFEALEAKFVKEKMPKRPKMEKYTEEWIRAGD